MENNFGVKAVRWTALFVGLLAVSIWFGQIGAVRDGDVPDERLTLRSVDATDAAERDGAADRDGVVWQQELTGQEFLDRMEIESLQRRAKQLVGEPKPGAVQVTPGATVEDLVDSVAEGWRTES